MDNVDHIDRKILNILQENAKVSHREIADRLLLTRTPIFDRIRKLERRGIIKKYITLLNPRKIDRGLTVLCFVTLKQHGDENVIRFKQEMVNNPKVMECYHVAGNFDFFLKVMVKDVDDYYLFVTTELAIAQNVSQVQSSFVLKEIKYQLNFELPE